MAPLDDLESRDLAWISDFVMQQVVIMLGPMVEHLQETDAACDHAQRMVQQVSMDVSEVRGDLERTNKYLTILRQGLGVQSETRIRTVKRLDDQMESMLTICRGSEDFIRQLTTDAQSDKRRHEDLATEVSASATSLKELQGSVELLSCETLAVKDGLLSSEARLEVSQRELRELRRGQLNMTSKLEDKSVWPPTPSQSGKVVDAAPWTQKKSFSAAVEPLSATAGGSPPALNTGSNFGETGSSHSGSRQESKRLSRVSSGTGPNPVGIGGLGNSLGGSTNASGSVDEAAATPSRLPALSSTRPVGTTRPEDHRSSRFFR